MHLKKSSNAMKKLFIFIPMMLAIVLGISQTQTIELSFTGVMNNGRYVPITWVEVENISRSWTEILTYPDTVLTLTAPVPPLGLDGAESRTFVMDNYPNPFRGNTTVNLWSDQGGDVQLSLYTLDGRMVTSKTIGVEQGCNRLEISVGQAGVYVLVATMPARKAVLKLMSRGGTGTEAIAFKGCVAGLDKRVSYYTFHFGDTLRYRAYTNYGGMEVPSRNMFRIPMQSQRNALVFLKDGILQGRFSVSLTKQVRFAQGNLQWSSAGLHSVAGGGTAEGTWRFAFNQYDAVLQDNENIGTEDKNWIDLFGWGTSGYDGYAPDMYALADSLYVDTFNIAGTNYEWGQYNAICNGGNSPGVWTMLSDEEWDYLISYRRFANMKRGVACVNGMAGLILLPDDWHQPQGIPFNCAFWPYFSNNDTRDTSTLYYALSNNYSLYQWQQMEDNGAVFLPVTGMRNGTVVNFLFRGYYWLKKYDSNTLLFSYFSPTACWGYGYPALPMKHTARAVRCVRAN